jgi:hypothetical protein
VAGESAREVARRAREKAERLERWAEHYERGAEGEELTAAALASLPSEWTVLHDVRWPGRRLANIDHVVLGPGGIFVIDSKNWSGDVKVTDGVLRQNGRSREKTVAAAADAALAVGQLVGPHLQHVSPVLCFTGGQVVSGWARDVLVCSTSNLTQMLTSRPVVLDSAASVDDWFRLDAQLRSAMERVTVGTGSRRVRGPRPEAARRPQRPTHSRRQASALSQLVKLLFVAVVMIVAGPALLNAISDAVSHAFVSQVDDATTCDPSVSPSTAPRPRKEHHGAKAHKRRTKTSRPTSSERSATRTPEEPTDC